MTDIAPIKGLIELQDNFTSELGLAEAALSHFSKSNQESLKAVAGAAGLVGAAIVAVTATVIELGKRGTEVNEVKESLEHFAGGAKAANDIMSSLRGSTKGTIDDFTLAKDAAHLLSAGVQLTADQFSTLGQAAIELQRRGLGPAKDQLELISDALVTGRTRALSMKLGVVENTNAQEEFAKKLGITVDQLSAAGKAEATRLEVMRLLTAATKDAGDEGRNFGQEFEFAEAQIANWVNDLGSAIAGSKVLMAGIQGVEMAVTSAFSGDKASSINTVTHYIEQGAVQALSFAQATVTMVKIVEGAWNAVRTVVLGVTTAVTGVVAAVVNAADLITSTAAKIHIVSPESVQGVTDLRIQLNAMTVDLAKQTAEAAKGVFGQTEFDKALDKVSAGLASTKAAMLTASDANAKHTETVNKTSDAAKKLTGTQAELNAKFIDGAKVAETLRKSTQELNDIYIQYNDMIKKSSGTARDGQIADIEAVFQKAVNALNKLDPLYKQKYEAYRKIADESLNEVGSDWDTVRDKSLESLQDQADAAGKTYDLMTAGSLHFTRQVMQEQLQKYKDLSRAAKGYGDDVKASIAEASNAVKLLDGYWVQDSDIAAQTLNKTTVMVRTLSGEIISLEEAQKRQLQGFGYVPKGAETIDQFTIDTTPGGADALLKQLKALSSSPVLNPANVKTWQDQNNYVAALAQYNALREAYNLLISQAKNPRADGFASGGTVGTVMVGEQGPEVVKLPIGSQVYPRGTGPADGGGGLNMVNHFYVNGTAADVAKQISDQIMRRLNTRRQFGSA